MKNQDATSEYEVRLGASIINICLQLSNLTEKISFIEVTVSDYQTKSWEDSK